MTTQLKCKSLKEKLDSLVLKTYNQMYEFQIKIYINGNKTDVFK